MARETVQTCPNCGSFCRALECGPGDHVYLRPLVTGSLEQEDMRAQILSVIQNARFNQERYAVALSMLQHVCDFLQTKGHKFMHLEVKRTLESMAGRRIMEKP